MINDQIKKYFSGESSEEEQEEILQYFKENISEVDKYFTEGQWEQMINERTNKTKHSETFLQNIIEDDVVPINKKRNIYRLTAAAAVLIFIIGTGIYLWQNKTAQQPTVPQPAIAAIELDGFVTQENPGNAVMTITLPDGSGTRLFPHSNIKYKQTFDSTKRDIYLEGEAIFEVHKDAARPFTVYCKEVATTALGTKFKVSALDKQGKVSVVLLEGKIVVKSTHPSSKADMKYYLLPGNEIEFNRQNLSFTFIENTSSPEKGSENQDVAASVEESETREVAPEGVKINTENKSIKFSDVSLAKVLDVLAKKYNVNISYPTNKIARIRFVGTIKEHDPLKKILSDITSMNGFELVADTVNNKYIIK
ncbi:FecR family protein [Chitinophagaceae bacterium LWZ2-11]